MPDALANRELSDLISGIYDCALDPSRWDATLDAIRTVLECPNAQLFLMDMRRNHVLIQKAIGVEAYWLERQARYLPEINAHVERWLDEGLSMDEPLVVSRLASPEMLAASPYFQEFSRPQGYVDIAQIHLMRSPSRLSGLGFGRHESVGVFGDREIDIMRLLLPHVRRAVTISNVLDAQAIETSRMAETLDILKLGIVITSGDSRIIHANRAAERMMQAGGPLHDGRGVLRASESAASAQIRAAIGLAARNEAGLGKTGLAVRLTREDKTPVFAHVLPLANGKVRSRLAPEAAAAIFISPAIDDSASAQALAATFSLTPAETRTLTRILSGKTVPEAAEDLGVAPATARTHLDSIFVKTGVSRQSDLIRLASRLAPAGQ